MEAPYHLQVRCLPHVEFGTAAAGVATSGRRHADARENGLIVDTHAHLIAGVRQYHYAKDFGPTDLLAAMDAAGVAKATVVQSRHGNGIDNPYPTSALAGFSSRLIPICGLDAQSDNGAEELKTRVTEWGARGVRIFCEGWKQDDPRFQHIWETATSLGVPIFLGGQMNFSAVSAMAERNPSLNVVLDHLGHPGLSSGPPTDLLALADRPNLSVKFSSINLEEADDAGLPRHDLFDSLLDAFGAHRMMWGSNYPSSHEPDWPYAKTVEAALQLVERYSTTDRALILAGTAMSIWSDTS